MTLDQQLPTANWPTESGRYNVVQLDIDGQPHLRFAEQEGEIHMQIMHTLCRELRRECMEIEVESESGGHPYHAPAQESDWYMVHGMGVADVNVRERRAHFSGGSLTYNLGINREQLEIIRSLEPEWKLE